MTQEDKNRAIRNYLRINGFRPREDKDLKKYIIQLNTRLGKENKKLYITDYGDYLDIKIDEKIKKIPKSKLIYSRVTKEEELNFKKLAEERNTTLAKLIRDLLIKEYENAGTNNNI